MMDPHKTQGSNKERAEGGLQPEKSFAAVDEDTSVRMSLEAKAVQEARAKGERLKPDGAQ